MKKMLTQLTTGMSLLLLITAMVSSCKKSKQEDPAPIVVSGMSGTIDGKAINVSESSLSTTYFNTPGDAVSSLSTTAALDANGSKMEFFIPDVKSGTFDITPKLGTSSNPGSPFLKVQASTSTTTQTYISYTSSGSVYYAISGSITVTVDDTKISMKWSISFKDAAGRVFTSAGEINIYFYKAVTKPKTEVKDPTPVQAKPTIDNIAATAGMAGDEVAIAGTNFSTTLTDNVVKFNGVAATVKTATATKLTVTVPTSTTGAVTVKVGNSETAIGPTFTYVLPATITGLSVNSGPVGTTVQINGTNFSTNAADNVVTVNGTVATATATSATSIVISIPTGATTGPIMVKVKGISATVPTQGANTFTVTAPSPFGVAGNLYALFTPYYGYQYKTYDNDGNLWVVDGNGQINKEFYTGGDPQKTILPSAFNGFTSISSYLCRGLTRDANGGVHAYIYGSGTGGAGNPTFVVSISTTGVVTKDFETQFYEKSSGAFTFNRLGDALMISSRYGSNDIIRLKPDGSNEVYLKGGNGTDNTLGAANAYDMCWDSGSLYVLTYVAGTPNTSVVICKFDENKNRTVVAALNVGGYQDGDVASAKFGNVTCIAVNGSSLYIGDQGNLRVRRLDLRSNMVTTVAGNGSSGAPVSGLAINSTFSSIAGLLADSRNNVFYTFANTNNNVIARIAQ